MGTVLSRPPEVLIESKRFAHSWLPPVEDCWGFVVVVVLVVVVVCECVCVCLSACLPACLSVCLSVVDFLFKVTVADTRQNDFPCLWLGSGLLCGRPLHFL